MGTESNTSDFSLSWSVAAKWSKLISLGLGGAAGAEDEANPDDFPLSGMNVLWMFEVCDLEGVWDELLEAL
jgi:hypothetical protein